MSTLGKVCKAYPLAQFRQFPGWTEATPEWIEFCQNTLGFQVTTEQQCK
jgi:uncharacterized protein YhbP (UPF0306 family)